MEREKEKEEEEAANLKSFLSWAAQLGISDSPSSPAQSENATCPVTCLGHTLVVSHFPEAGGRGLAAARDLRKGELILKVPKEALMTSESLLMKDDTLSFAINKHHTSLCSTQILAVALLNEVSKGKSSWWHPYLKQMPRSYDTLASFSQLEIQALQMEDAMWAAEKAVEKAELDWKGASPVLGGFKLKPQLCTFKAWLWASATISSRTMHIPWDDAGCLCPVGDFFNYAAPGEEPINSEYLETCVKGLSLHYCPLGEENMHKPGDELSDISAQRLIDAGYEEDVAAYCFYARRNYRKGEQVLLSYGTYTNLELLEHYGFLLNENPNEKAFIPLEPDMYSLCSWPRESLYIHQDGKASFALLSTLRLWAIPGNQRRSTGYLAYSGHQLSAENEVTVMRWLAEKCHCVLDSLSTSVEQDGLLLRIIEKTQDVCQLAKLDEKQSSFSTELRGFLQNSGMMDREFCSKSDVASKRRKSVHRLQLAVQWRLNYKRTLADCIKHCTEFINNYLTGSKHPRT